MLPRDLCESLLELRCILLQDLASERTLVETSRTSEEAMESRKPIRHLQERIHTILKKVEFVDAVKDLDEHNAGTFSALFCGEEVLLEMLDEETRYHLPFTISQGSKNNFTSFVDELRKGTDALNPEVRSSLAQRIRNLEYPFEDSRFPQAEFTSLPKTSSSLEKLRDKILPYDSALRALTKAPALEQRFAILAENQIEVSLPLDKIPPADIRAVAPGFEYFAIPFLDNLMKEHGLMLKPDDDRHVSRGHY
ncbi:MAG TPA: hypothetical protein VGZ00_01445 [Candidatus Baltobacteraceae bacterium]|nr:hypothetical protein [Candidatus Baltobacteraceae bacterium]